MCSIASLMLIYGAIIQFKIDMGLNLFKFNRLVGSICIGRAFYMLRGGIAVLFLSTSQISFVQEDVFAHFKNSSREFIRAVFIAGEASWQVKKGTDIDCNIF